MKRSFFLLSLLTTLALVTSSCLYKMPEEDYVELRPTTNNPNIIRQGSDSVPGLSM